MANALNNKGDNISEFISWTVRVKKFYSKTAFFVQYYVKKLFFQIKRRAPHLKKLHLQSFSAIHIKKMDWMDFTLKFSSELLVLILTVTVAGLNLYFFSASAYNDQSLANSFLSRHEQLNPKLYAKNSAIITTVSEGGFIPEAQADDFTGLDSQGVGSSDPSSDGSDLVMGDENSILAPNPDSVAGLIAKQIKIYQTQTGDTLKSISNQFGISVDTIKNANKLTADAIKPGWQLIILPTDGVLVKATSNDTIPDLANKYKVGADKIIAYNALDGAEDINAGDLIIIPGAYIAPPPAPVAAKPTAKKPARDTSKVGGGGAVEEVLPDYNAGAGHVFPKGYCTWYVAQKLGGRVQWGGNAKAWLANAKAYGAVISKTPAVGSIMVSNESKYGHVALVESVDADGFTVTEMNYEHFGVVDTRYVSNNNSHIRGFIYP